MKAFAFFVFSVCCFVSMCSFAQTPKQIEADLLKSFQEINYYNLQKSDDTTGAVIDSLYGASDVFAAKLADYAKKYSFTIKLPFDSLVNAGLEIATSKDFKLRIYSWDTGTGGAQPAMSNVVQCKYGTKLDTLFNLPADPYGSPGPIDEIYQFHIYNKTYYLVKYSLAVGYSDHYQGIMLVAIINGKLETAVKLVKTASGLNSHLSCYYLTPRDNQKYSDDAYEIKFNEKTRIITLPLIDENNQITGKHITYKFTGKYFEKLKN